MLTNTQFVFALPNTVCKFMLAIKLYIFALTAVFLVLVIATRGLGILEAVVITCSMLYLIIDAKADLKAMQTELQLLQELEGRIATLFHS